MATFFTIKPIIHHFIKDNTEKVQYSACIEITGAIRGTSKEKIYHEFGLESLESRRWFFLHFRKKK